MEARNGGTHSSANMATKGDRSGNFNNHTHGGGRGGRGGSGRGPKGGRGGGRFIQGLIC
jgi:hypothetical protein